MPSAVSRLVAVLGDRGMVLQTRDADSLAAAARRCRDAAVDVVAVVGGDGTAGIALAALHAAYEPDEVPPVALLRGGTMNTVAHGLGISRGRPETNLGRLLSQPAHRPPPHVRCETLDVGGRLGFLFGTGAFHGFMEAYYRSGRGDPTAWTALQTISRAAFSAAVQSRFIRELVQLRQMTLTVDGAVWAPRGYLTVAAGTVREVGLGFAPFFRAHEAVGAFHAVAIHGASSRVVRELPRIWRGRPLRSHAGRDIVARELTVASKTPFPYMVDGDLFPATAHLTVRSGPAVRIVAV